MQPTAGSSPFASGKPTAAVNLQVTDIPHQGVKVVAPVKRPVLIRAKRIGDGRPGPARVVQIAPEPELSACGGDALTRERERSKPVPGVSLMHFTEPTPESVDQWILRPAMPAALADEIWPIKPAPFIWCLALRTRRAPERADASSRSPRFVRL